MMDLAISLADVAYALIVVGVLLLCTAETRRIIRDVRTRLERDSDDQTP